MAPRPVALEDLYRFLIVGDTQLAPDGRRVVFCARRTDQDKNKYFTRLWIAGEGDAEARPFTGDMHSDSAPRWSPDGSRICFVSDRQKPGAQIYLIGPDGGEAEQLTRLDEGQIQSPAWSPDGSRIAFLYRATPEQYTEKARKEREEKGLSAPVRVHERLFYRLDGFGYWDHAFWQIAVADVNTGETTVLTNEQCMLSSPAWTPDGGSLLFTANRSDDWDTRLNHDSIWRIPAAGGDLTQIQAPDGPKDHVSPSPDGAWIAWIGHPDPEDSWGGKNERVLLIPATGAAEARDLTGPSDKQVGYSTLCDMHDVGGGRWLQWSPDGGTLYFPVSERGDTRLYRIRIDGEGMTPLTPPDHELGSFSLSRDGRRIGVQIGSATKFYKAEILEAGSGGAEVAGFWDLNKDLLAEVALQQPDEFDIPNGDGGKVHGWVLRPAGFTPGQSYPCILYVHGGPAAQYGGRSAPFHELQWLAAQGYVVVFSNPRGSKGYGEAHTSAIRGDWGNRDWNDVQKVADYAADLPYVDAGRMAIMGGSYGGFMTAWAVGHTDRFACAIADRLVGNLHSMAGTCDFPWEHGKNWKGNAWDDPSDLWRCSPLHYAGAINTPLLIIHSDGDLRCPVGQAEELFEALRMQRKPVEMVRYPGESSHGLSRNGPPDLRIDRLQRNLDWLDRHLKKQ